MKKIILHIDFNSYFASVEQQANPFLRNEAIGIGGKIIMNKLSLKRTIIATASKEAKKLGIKTAMPSTTAKKILPELKIIQGDPLKYSEITKRFISILKQHTDCVEQFSVDEAFADLTYTCGDYFSAIFTAQMIKQEIKNKCGKCCTVSIGIGPNKLVAKLASNSIKPNGLTVVQPHEVESFILKHQLKDICGIGVGIEKKLHKMNITSIKSLKATPLHVLLKEFKNYGYFLYSIARGIGDEIINEKISQIKSINHSYTYSCDLINDHELKTNLLAISDRVARRMRKQNFLSKTLTVVAKYSNGKIIRTQKHYREPMNDGLNIYKNAWSLLKSHLNKNEGIRLLGVSVSDLIQSNMPKKLLKKDNKMNLTLLALDKIQHKYGTNSWHRAATISTIFKERMSGWNYDHKII